MDELFKKMLENDILSEETKKELLEAFTAEIEKAKAEAKEIAIAEAKVDFAKQFAEDKDALVEALDTKVTLFLNEELEELKEDVERFRDLEVEYSTKLVEEKEKMGLQLKADMAQLVEALDVFLEERLTEEMVELKESIEEVKKIEFAKNLFESIEVTFKKKFFDENGLTKQLAESASVLTEKSKKLDESEAKLAKLVRKEEMSRVLEPLHGRPREIMEAILKSVDTNKLDEGYTRFIGKVLHESTTTVEQTPEKEIGVKPTVLAENASKTEIQEDTKVVSGNSAVNEHVEPKQNLVSDAEKLRLRKIAGMLK